MIFNPQFFCIFCYKVKQGHIARAKCLSFLTESCTCVVKSTIAVPQTKLSHMGDVISDNHFDVINHKLTVRSIMQFIVGR